ncbi:Kelch repeat-containing protein [Caproicibacter sp.]|uniref:Kelch repeat-containing protein n=1 Tax=Caproicibacter sp. TaxID=2814884 RepID=UPI003988D6CD
MPNIIRVGGSGGSDLKLNVFAQPDLPTNKFDGILLQTGSKETLKKIVFDDNIWAAGQWQNPSLVTNMPGSRYSACCALVGSEVYIFGGYNGEDNLSSAIKYNPSTNTYTSIASMPEARGGACCAIVGGEVYIFGGYSGAGYLSSAIKYSPSTNSYTSIASIPGERASACCAEYNGEVYIFGGYNGEDNLSSAIKYNPSTNSYASIADIPANQAYACCALVGSEVYIFGGYRYPSTFFPSAIKYNPSTNTYTSIASMPEARGYACCALVGSEVYIFGGYYNHATLSTVFHYMLTAKQYPNSPSFLIYRINGDITHEASISKGKLIDSIPINFKDCMLFKDGEITFPALYIGDGTQWNLARPAQ